MGNTAQNGFRPIYISVHPHTHGEHDSCQRVECPVCGSSPHAWGTLLLDTGKSIPPWFIPTRMGNTAGVYTDVNGSAVHPHTHGEHTRWFVASVSIFGSSPHAWGTLQFPLLFYLSRRFIPTRMGNTIPVSVLSALSAVHPHTHGEHYCLIPANQYPHGSSPHAWGTLLAYIPMSTVVRFIPTRMGNTLDGLWPRCRSSVHPHTHGEHYSFLCSFTCLVGSSPHAWGTLGEPT